MAATEFPFRQHPAVLTLPENAPDAGAVPVPYQGPEDEESGEAPDPDPSAIPYWPDPLTYSERFTAGRGTTAAVNIVVDGPNAGLFLKYALGFARAVAPGAGGDDVVPILERYLPLALPYNPKLFCSDLVMVEGGDWTPDPAANNWPAWPWVKYRATFEGLPFEVLPDADLPPTPEGAPDELARFVKRAHRPSFRERKVPGHMLETDAGDPIPESAFVIDRSVEWSYTVYRWPWASYPRGTIKGLAGCVNSETFDTVANGMNAPPGTVLFRGVAEEIEPYRGRDGELYVDFALLLGQKETGWNKYVPPGSDPLAAGSPVGIRYRTTDPPRRPYPAADLHWLFEPGPAPPPPEEPEEEP